MNAAEFIVKFGWTGAELDINAFENGFITRDDFLKNYGFEILDEIKTYVDAWEFVQKKGGLTGAKRWLQTEESEPYYNYEQSVVDELKKNVALVEEVESLKEVC